MAGGPRTWLSPKTTDAGERLVYGLVGTVLIVVSFLGFGLMVLSWAGGVIGFGLFGLALGVLALILGYRMLVAAATGRRMYWWPGQREYDDRGIR